MRVEMETGARLSNHAANLGESDVELDDARWTLGPKR